MHSNDDFRWKGDNIYLRLTFFRILLSMNSFSESIMYNLTKDRIIRCRIARSSYLKLDRDRIFDVSSSLTVVAIQILLSKYLSGDRMW